MNMKTTKFLAVLAVLVMAFAVVAVADDSQVDAQGAEISGVYDADGEAVTTLEIDEATTWYVDTTASITGDNITITAGESLTIELKSGVTASTFSIVGASIAAAEEDATAGSMTISSGITLEVSDAFAVNGTLTVNGVLENNNPNADELTVGEGGKITGSGKIAGTSSRLVNISQGTLEEVTISQEDWAAGIANWYPVNVAENTGNVTISGITVLLKDCETEDVKGMHGIRVVDVTEDTTVTLKNIRFGAVNDATLKAENLINIQDNGSNKFLGTVDVSGITVDSNVTPKDTYGQLQVNNIKNVGTKVKFNDNSISILRIAGACTITNDVSVEKVVFKSGSTNKLTIAEGKTLKSDAILAEGTSITLTNAGVSNSTTVGATFIGTVTYDGSVADVALRAGSADVVIAAGSVTVTGTIGALDGSKIEQISGDVALNLTVPEKTTLDIYGELTGSISDAGTVNINTGADITDLDITTSGSGKIIDNTDDDDMEELVIGGNSQGQSTEFSAEQKVIVSSELGYWTLNSGSKVTINGVLVIPEGTVMTVQADAELLIQNGAKVYVYGTLVIDAKESGNNDAGILTIDSGFISVEGLVSLNGTLDMDVNSSYITEIDVEYGGLLVIGEAGKVLDELGSEFYVAEGGELTVYGTMGANIWNSGEITIDSDVDVSTSTTIYMWSPDAIVDVRNYTINADSTATLTISDKGLVFLTYKKEGQDVNVTLRTGTVGNYTYAEDKIVIGMNMTSTPTDISDYSITFSGISVTAGCKTTSVTSDDKADAGIYNKKQYSKYLDVSGMFYMDYTYIGTSVGSDQTISATVDTYTETTTYASQCSIQVSEAIVINDYVTFGNKAGMLTVTGSIDTMSKDAKVTNADEAKITVSGAGNISCVVNTISSETGINAAKFMTVATDISGKTYKIYNYYSIDGALAVVAAEPVTSEIIILGTQTMKLSASLPAGISLVLINSSAVLNINKDVAFEIEAGATLKGEGTVNVNGSMYANEKTDVKNSVTVISDVKTEELDEKGKPTKNGWALWTNLTDAIAAAEAGDVITITKKTTGGYVTVAKNLTIPEGVTLVAPSGFDPLLLKNGVTLTIDGIVVVGSNIYAQQAFGLNAQNITSTSTDASRQSSAIVVNGALFSTVQVNYGNGYAATSTVTSNTNAIALFNGTYISGAKYVTSSAAAAEVEGAVTAPIAGAYYTLKDGSTTYYVVSSLAFAATVADDISGDHIRIHGDVSGLILTFEGNDTLKNIVIGKDDAAESITAPTVTGYTVATELTVATLVIEDLTLDATYSAFSGIVGNGTDAITLYDAKGITVIDADDKLYIDGEMTFATTDGFAVISAGTVYLGKATGFTTENTLAVGDDATAIVENEVTITGILFVAGTFQVPAGKTATITYLYDLGVVDVAATTETTSQGTLNIAENGVMYIGCDGIPAAEKTEFEIAYLNGPISFGNEASVYMMDDAVVDLEASACLLALKHTTFFIEDDVFFTEFAKGEVELDTTIPKILDAVISMWVDEDGDDVDGNYVGAVDEVYAMINYNIYGVYIVTDAGVKSVAINGIEMISLGNNVFTLGVDDKLTPLIAGTYKVTYTLKSGYQEDKNGVTLYTEDGTILANHSFVAGGSDEEITIKLQLNGTEIIPEPEPVTPEEQSEWTITTILLVILVILIAIMAVIVALRLNRN